MNRFFKLLVNFSRGERVSRSNAIRYADEQLVDSALELGFLIQCGKNSVLEPLYMITELGRTARDANNL